MVLGGSTSRALGLTVSTTNCLGLRSEPYKYQLLLSYDYLIEYGHGDGGETLELDLIGVENAVAYGVAAAFGDCDKDESPLYAVELASRHEVFQDGYCAPVDSNNGCQVIRGYTEIRLDTVNPTVEAAAYGAIESALHEPLFLQQFVTRPFSRVDFVRAVDQVLKTNEAEDAHNSTSLVAIAAAILSFALASIFFAGFWRSRIRKKVRAKKQVEAPGNKKRFLLGSVPRNYYELDEETGGSGDGFKMVQIMEPYENPSATWSISDITSESGSILSNLSRTTSKLERIEEADNESAGTDEDVGQLTDSIPPEYLFDLSSSPRNHVDQWDVDAMEEGTEPEGCRYLEDSSDDEEDFTDVDYEGDATEACFDHSEGFDHQEDFNRSIDTAIEDEDDEYQSLSSLLNTSEDTVETSNETRAVLHESVRDFDDNQEEEEKVQKWLVELVKALRKAQNRKLLTYTED